MSNKKTNQHKYNKMYDNKLAAEKPVEEIVEDKTEEIHNKEIVEDKTEEIPNKGIVSGCKLLNVRIWPSLSSDVVCIIEEGTVVNIKHDSSTKDWYNVTVGSDVEGFCFKKFIDINK